MKSNLNLVKSTENEHCLIKMQSNDFVSSASMHQSGIFGGQSVVWDEWLEMGKYKGRTPESRNNGENINSW